MGREVRFEFVTFAHVGEAAYGAVVRWCSSGKSTADMQQIGVGWVPIRRVGDDIREEVGQTVLLDPDQLPVPLIISDSGTSRMVVM